MASVTRDEVWEMFQEIARRAEKTDQLMTKRAEEADRRLKETDRQMKERAKEADRRLRETERQMKERSEELDRRFKETEHQVKETSKKVGELGNRLGDFVQEMVRPAVVRLFKDRGIDVHEVYPNVSVKRDEDTIEIDLLVVNNQEAIAVECKSNLDIDDIKEHLKRLDKIKLLIPKLHDVRLVGAVAAMVISDNAARYAYKRGLYVLAQNGDSILIRNDDKFSPKVW